MDIDKFMILALDHSRDFSVDQTDLIEMLQSIVRECPDLVNVPKDDDDNLRAMSAIANILMRRFAKRSFRGGVRQCTFALTPEGRNMATAIRQRHPGEYTKVRNTVEKFARMT